MKTHNLERQTALKRKRDEADEAARARVAVANEKAAKRPRLQAEKAQSSTRNSRNAPRRAKPKAATRSRVRKEQVPVRQASLPVPSEPTPHSAPETAEPLPSERPQEENPHPGPAVVEEQVAARYKAFLSILISNAASHERLRCLSRESRQCSLHLEQCLPDGENGIKDLEAQIAVKEPEGHDVRDLRQTLEVQQATFSDTQEFRESIDVSSRDLSKCQVKRNSRIYGYADLQRDTQSFDCLSEEFWVLFDECRAANTVSVGLELEMHELEQTQDKRLEDIDECARSSVHKLRGGATEAITSPPEVVAENSSELMKGAFRTLEELSFRKHELLESLQRARSERAKSEAKLNDFTLDLLHQRQVLTADPLGENTAKDNLDIAVESTQDGNDDSSSMDANGEDLEPEMHSGGEPPNESQGPSEPRAARDNDARSGAVKRSKECEAHKIQSPLSEAVLAASETRVAKARKTLALCKSRFKQIRNYVPPEALFLDREIQGPARVKNMSQKTRELIEAEIECRDALHEAQNAHVIINEPCQSSNFCDGSDETFTNGFSGHPLHRLRADDVQRWVYTATGNDQSVSTPDLEHDIKMDWDRLPEPGYGEALEYIAGDRNQQYLMRNRKLQEALRREGPFEGAENDLHVRNRDTNIVPEIDPPRSWGEIKRPMQPSKYAEPSQAAHGFPEDTANGHPDGPNPMMAHGEGGTPGSKNAQISLYDPDAPMVDYAIEGYDGLNMDGIE